MLRPTTSSKKEPKTSSKKQPTTPSKKEPEEKKEEIWQKFVQLRHIPQQERSDDTFRCPFLELLRKLFVTDVQFAFEHHADEMMFGLIKDHIDKSKTLKSSKFDEAYENAVLEGIAELSNLSTIIQLKHGFTIKNAPSPASMCPDVIMPKPKSESLSDVYISYFSHFICLRLGDLFRYLHEQDMARELYVCAFDSNPDNGQSCNQIGLLEGVEKRYFDALYYHLIALNTREAFMPAATNIEQIYNKFASINIEDGNSDYDAVFLKVMGRCHSLSPSDACVLQRMSVLLREETTDFNRLQMHFVIEVAVYNELDTSEDEVSCSNHIISIIADQFTALLEQCSKCGQTRKDRERLLSTLWIYVSWIEAKKISLMNTVNNAVKWLRDLAVVLDACDSLLMLECTDPHFVPLSFLDYENACVSSLVNRLTVILWRTLKSYRINEMPSENFTSFIDENSSSLSVVDSVPRRRQRVSRTVPILSAI